LSAKLPASDRLGRKKLQEFELFDIYAAANNRI